MQKMKVVIKKVCHSRKFLSGIFHVLICYVHKAKTLYINNQYVEDPRLQTSGMTPYFITAQGFTLIELLVVVLIIGILATVAVPQYQKAVYKSRLNSIKHLAISVANAQEIYYLGNNSYATSLDELDMGMPTEENDEYGWYIVTGTTFKLNDSFVSVSVPGLFSFQKYYMHTNNVDKGGAKCLANAENDVANAICKSETKSNTPVWTGKSIGYTWNSYKYQ